MVLNETSAATNEEKCELFARHFASVFREPEPILSTDHLDTVPSDLVDITWSCSWSREIWSQKRLKSCSRLFHLGLTESHLLFWNDVLINWLSRFLGFSTNRCKKPNFQRLGQNRSCFLSSKKSQNDPSKTTEESRRFARGPNYWKSSSVTSFYSTAVATSHLNSMDLCLKDL